MGLGLYEDGSGISATKFLLSQKAKVTVTDLKSKEQLQEQIKRLGSDAKKIKFVLGEHRESDFISADLIIKNPGVPRTSKFLKIAKENNIPIETDISLFFQLVDKKRIVAITGTRGKSTTTTLIYEFIKTQDKNSVLGGNITKSPLSQMAKVKKNGKIVLELSSWLLESLESKKLSPHIAVFTNIYPDHLNTYDNLEDYAEAKKNIFAWQDKNDFVILNRDNAWTKKMGRLVSAQRFWFSLHEFKHENGIFVRGGKIVFRQNGVEQNICSVSDIKIPGVHNLYNALGAICTARISGIKILNIKKVIKDFKGIPDRLEFLKEIGGIKYYNDTTSTTPEATLSALKAIAKNKNIILIAGGSDKGLDFKILAKEIKKNCRVVILLKDTGSERIKKLLMPNSKFLVTETASMIDAVGLAKSFAKAGDIILLSPACASFGLFKNEFDRGNQFKNIVKKLK